LHEEIICHRGIHGQKKNSQEPGSEAKIADYRYDDSKRKNIPSAVLAAQAADAGGDV